MKIYIYNVLFSGTNLIKAQQLRITLGQHDLTKHSNSYEMQIKDITMHPLYRCDRVSHDLAIMELVKSIQWSDNVLPACLPNGFGETGYNRFDNSIATVAGWGWLNENSQKGKQLQEKIHVIFRKFKYYLQKIISPKSLYTSGESF